MIEITIKLTAYNMARDTTEAEFDRWVAYVDSIMGSGRGEDTEDTSGLGGGVLATIKAYPFTSGPSDDGISIYNCPGGHIEETRESVREALQEVWERWCSLPTAEAAL